MDNRLDDAHKEWKTWCCFVVVVVEIAAAAAAEFVEKNFVVAGMMRNAVDDSEEAEAKAVVALAVLAERLHSYCCYNN